MKNFLSLVEFRDFRKDLISRAAYRFQTGKHIRCLKKRLKLRFKIRPAARLKKRVLMFCSVAHVAAVYSQSRRSGIENFQSRRSRHYLRSRRFRRCFESRRSRWFFFSVALVFNCQVMVAPVWNCQYKVAPVWNCQI